MSLYFCMSCGGVRDPDIDGGVGDRESYLCETCAPAHDSHVFMWHAKELHNPAALVGYYMLGAHRLDTIDWDSIWRGIEWLDSPT